MEVKDCCFCIELRTGSLIIAYLNLISSIILASVAAYVGITAFGINGLQNTPIFDAIVIFLIINLIFNIVLLVGLHKNKRGHVKAYLIFTMIFIVVRVIPVVASIVGESYEKTFAYFVNLVLYIYFLIVIRSYWLKMDDASSTTTVENTA